MTLVKRSAVRTRFGTACVAMVCASAVFACQVPVFRYALERWQPDQYEILVLHEGTLTKKHLAKVESLRELAGKQATAANFTVKSVRVDEKSGQAFRGVWSDNRRANDPVVAVLYPSTAQEVPSRLVTTMPLGSEATKSLVDSPLRSEIAKRLISGQSAVWVFVPIGDPEQDRPALEALQKEVRRNQETLELPEQEEAEDEDALLAEVDIELRLEFSIVMLKRDDPKETFLLDMLLGSESDLRDLKQPMAFPVLGRGRVLYALVGKGIAEDTIGIASRFMIGPCSCQVKNQNPGFDLLMSCDWDQEVGTNKLSDAIPEERTKVVPLTIPPGKQK